MSDRDYERKIDRDTVNKQVNNTYNPDMANRPLVDYLTGIANTSQKEITNPNRDWAWMLLKVFYAVLALGGVLLAATFIEYLQNK